VTVAVHDSLRVVVKSRRLRAAGAAIAALSVFAGLLAAQRLYRGLPLPPESSLIAEPEDGAEPAEFYMTRMAYSDRHAGFQMDRRPWQIDTPAAERHFLQGLRRLSAVNANSKENYVHPNDDRFFDFPFLYVVEAGHWDLTELEVENIREYLLRGGFIMLDDFHGTDEWEFFMRGMRQIFPAREVVDIPAHDEIFHVLYDLENREQIPGVQMLYSRRPYERDGKVPKWRGIYDDDGRLMVMINHNMDLGDAWEHADWPEYPERFTAMSYRLAINYIIHAMTH